MAFFNLEGPAGGRRGDFQAALIASTMARVMGGKRAQSLKLEDFLLDFEKEELRELSADEMVAVVKQWQAALG